MKKNIIKLITNKQLTELKQVLINMNCHDISELFGELTTEQMIIAYRLLPKDFAVEAFAYLAPGKQEILINAFNDTELSVVINDLFMDDAVDLTQEMPSNVVKRILKSANPDNRKMINELLNYPSDSAGSIMTTEFVDLKSFMSVEEAFSRIKEIGIDKETIYTSYVLDESRKLIGIVPAKSLLLTDRGSKISDIMETNLITVNTLDDQEDVAKKIRDYDFIAMPVVDSENRLVGIITVDDAIDVIHEEVSEDFEKMAAIKPNKEEYFKTSVFNHAKNRILWLIVLMLSTMFIGTIITEYEETFATIPLLVAFIPMLMGTGGNCGAQTSTLVIRGLSVEEIHTKNIWKVLWKELRVSLLVGVSLAILCAMTIILIIRHDDPALALVVGLALTGTVTIAKTIGCLLPLAAKKLKLDPAIMAAPLITTIVDALAILLYFNIAVFILNI